MADDSVARIISAIAGLWKLATIFAATFVLFLFRKPLCEVVPKLKKLKRGSTEIEWQDRPESLATEAARTTSQAMPPQKEKSSEPPASEEVSFVVIWRAIAAGKPDEAEKAFQELLKKEPDKKRDHELFYLTLRCDFLNDSSAAVRLEGFKGDPQYQEELSRILQVLGRFYQETEQFPKALDRFGEAEKAARNQADRAYAIGAQARVLAASGDTRKGLSLLVTSIPKFSEPEALAMLYQAVADAHRMLGHEFEEAIALEKVAQCKPTDNSALFAAAYAQSEAELPYLSLHNYSLDLRLNPTDSTARNNYGVQLARFKLPISSVKQYCRAQGDGNTLAMSNLAYLYIEKGFVEDAERMLNEARRIENYHGNVDRALARLRGDQEEEDKRLQKIGDQARVYQTFVRAFAEALLLPPASSPTFGGGWRSPDGDLLSISQDGDNFSVEWGKPSVRKKLTGRQTNRAAKAELSQEHASLLSGLAAGPYFSGSREVLLFLSEDNATMSMLSLGAEEPIHLVFTRLF